MDLPDILAKPAKQQRPLALNFELSDKQELPVELNYGDDFSAALKIDSTRQLIESGHVLLGNGRARQRTEPGVMVEIDRNQLQLQDWIKLTGAQTSIKDTKLDISEIKVHGDQALWSQVDVGRFDLDLKHAGVFWEGKIGSTILQGLVKLPADMNGPERIDLKLDSLNVSALIDIKMGEGQGSTSAYFPSLTVSSDKTLWQDADLGRFVMNAERIPGGLLFDRFELQGKDQKLTLADRALEAIEQGIDKLRINPGNIGSEDKIKKVVLAAKKKKIPIRIGVNAGSLEKEILAKYNGKVTARGMVDSAMRHIRILEKHKFSDIVISLKASDIERTVEAYRLLSRKVNYPLHIGVTEAGTIVRGTVISSIGLGILLYDRIGDTLRVSLTADPVEEVRVAWEILKSLGLRRSGITVTSCPTCGRTEIDLIDLAKKVEAEMANFEKDIHWVISRTIFSSSTTSIVGVRCSAIGPSLCR